MWVKGSQLVLWLSIASAAARLSLRKPQLHAPLPQTNKQNKPKLPRMRRNLSSINTPGCGPIRLPGLFMPLKTQTSLPSWLAKSQCLGSPPHATKTAPKIHMLSAHSRDVPNSASIAPNNSFSGGAPGAPRKVLLEALKHFARNAQTRKYPQRNLPLVTRASKFDSDATKGQKKPSRPSVEPTQSSEHANLTTQSSYRISLLRLTAPSHKHTTVSCHSALCNAQQALHKAFLRGLLHNSSTQWA